MTRPVELVAVVGSLRAASLNRLVFDAAAELAGPEATITELDVRSVPFYDGDVEAAGDPPSVVALREAVRAADGLILFTPEYNGSIPAVTKNVVDWLSRVPGDSALTHASVGIVAGTPGRHAVDGVRRHLGESLAVCVGHPFPEALAVSGIGRKSPDGHLADPETRGEIRRWLLAFVAHIVAKPHPDIEPAAD